MTKIILMIHGSTNELNEEADSSKRLYQDAEFDDRLSKTSHASMPVT